MTDRTLSDAAASQPQGRHQSPAVHPSRRGRRAAFLQTLTVSFAAFATASLAADQAPIGQWLGATSVDSLPEIVRLKTTNPGELVLRYENDRKCQVQAKYVKFEGDFFQYQIGKSTCAHIEDPTTDIWIRPIGDKLEYRLARKADKSTAEVGYLYKN